MWCAQTRRRLSHPDVHQRFTAPPSLAYLSLCVLQDGDTAINKAARWGHSEVVRQLVIAGANVQQTTTDGWAPVLGAAEAGHDETLVELARGGADVNHRSNVRVHDDVAPADDVTRCNFQTICVSKSLTCRSAGWKLSVTARHGAGSWRSGEGSCGTWCRVARLGHHLCLGRAWVSPSLSDAIPPLFIM